MIRGLVVSLAVLSSVFSSTSDALCFSCEGSLFSNPKSTDQYIVHVYITGTSTELDTTYWDYMPNGTEYWAVWCDYPVVDIRVEAIDRDTGGGLVGVDIVSALDCTNAPTYNFTCE